MIQLYGQRIGDEEQTLIPLSECSVTADAATLRSLGIFFLQTAENLSAFDHYHWSPKAGETDIVIGRPSVINLEDGKSYEIRIRNVDDEFIKTKVGVERIKGRMTITIDGHEPFRFAPNSDCEFEDGVITVYTDSGILDIKYKSIK
jgi:hypothetical protein